MRSGSVAFSSSTSTIAGNVTGFNGFLSAIRTRYFGVMFYFQLWFLTTPRYETLGYHSSSYVFLPLYLRYMGRFKQGSRWTCTYDRYSYARRLHLEMCSLYSTIHSRVFGSWSSFPGTVMSSEVCRNNAPAVAFPTRTAINDFLLFLFFSLGVYLSRAWMGEKLISISENFASLALQSAFSFFFFFFVVVAVIRYRLKDCEHVNA